MAICSCVIFCTLYHEQLGNESVNKIVRLATATFHGKAHRIPDTTRVLHEIQLDYLRTMCKIVFETYQRLGRNPEVFASFYTEPPPSPLVLTASQHEASNNRKHTAPPVDYADQFIGFSFQTFLTSPEALAALNKVNEECYRVLQYELFSTKTGRSLKLEVRVRPDVFVHVVDTLTQEPGCVLVAGLRTGVSAAAANAGAHRAQVHQRRVAHQDRQHHQDVARQRGQGLVLFAGDAPGHVRV